MSEEIKAEEKEPKIKKKVTVKNIIFLQIIVVIYTLAGISGKFASDFDFLSFKFIAFYAGEIVILGIYALLWQQVIKKVDLSIAYANRAIALMWSMIWAVVFFHENITVKNIIGVIIVIIGTIIVNGEKDE